MTTNFTSSAEITTATCQTLAQEHSIFENRQHILEKFDRLLDELQRIYGRLGTTSLGIDSFLSSRALNDYANAHEAGVNLYQALRETRNEFITNPEVTPENFQNRCKAAIKLYGPRLAKHPGYTEIINKISFYLASFLTLGLLPLVTLIATNGKRARPSFFQLPETEAGSVVKQMESQINIIKG